MAFKIILDSNIILDLTLERSADYLDLQKIYENIVDGHLECYTTSIIIQTSAYWIEKKKGVHSAKKILLALLNDITVIEAPHGVIVSALYSNMPDIEDAVQYYMAMHHNIDAFISRDKEFIKSAMPKLPIYNPADFISKFF